MTLTLESSIITCTVSFLCVLVTELQWSVLQCKSLARVWKKIILCSVSRTWKIHLKYIFGVLVEIIKTQQLWIKILGGNTVLNMPEHLCFAYISSLVWSCSGTSCIILRLDELQYVVMGKENERGSVWVLYMEWRIQLQSSLSWLDHTYAIHELRLSYMIWTQVLVIACADVFKPWCVEASQGFLKENV
jgi:hypothetical protein